MSQDAFPNLKGTLFIVTYGRSGSTLLQSLIQTIPGTHITGENTAALHGLFSASRRARKSHNTWGRKQHAKTHPWFGANLIDPNRFEKRLSEVFIEEIIQPPPEARWFGFKEIRYPQLEDDFTPFLRFCRRTFPNAFFIFNSRNGEDVAQSKWWARQPKDRVLKLVETMDQRFATFAENNPTQSHHVFHEQTRADPQSLQPLFDKLGEPLDLTAMQEIMSQPLTH